MFSEPCPPHAPFDIVWLINKNHSDRMRDGWGPFGIAITRCEQVLRFYYTNSKSVKSCVRESNKCHTHVNIFKTNNVLLTNLTSIYHI